MINNIGQIFAIEHSKRLARIIAEKYTEIADDYRRLFTRETIAEKYDFYRKFEERGKNQIHTAITYALEIKPRREIREHKKSDENTVFIGGKPFMNYVTGVVMQFTTKGAREVIVKARGKFISRAVDVAEVSTKRFLKEQNITVKNIKIDSEEFENKEGRRVNVSTIDIILTKK